MGDLFQNTIIDHSKLQLLYNITHWLVGIGFLGFAISEFFLARRKTNQGFLRFVGPLIFSLNGVLFVLYVVVGISLYLSHHGMPIKFVLEHKIHIVIGSIWALTGIAEIIIRHKKTAYNTYLRLVLPISLVITGLLFLHPQHGSGDVLQYMTNYHRVLAFSLIFSGLFWGFGIFFKHRFIFALALMFIASSGIIALLYRHKYNITALCYTEGTTHYVTIGAESTITKATLCDKVQLSSSNDQLGCISTNDHAHHKNSSSPAGNNPSAAACNIQLLTLQESGTFTYQNGTNSQVSSTIIVEKPSDVSNWKVLSD